MSSNGGADAGSGAGAEGQDPNKPNRRQSKRAKNETDQRKWNMATERVYYQPNLKFPAVDDHEPNGGANWAKPPILVFFNAKGGTLKTTHTWNIAYTLSSKLRGLKVLAVDMDSQRDLSRSMLKAKLQAEASGAPPIGIQKYLARPFTPEEVLTNPILEPTNPLFGAAGLARTLEGALQPMMGDSPFVKRVVPEQVGDNLFLLPGSPVMEDIDRHMTISEGQLHDATQRNWQGAPLHIIMETAKTVEADIVLLDLNPSLSTINRNMIMSSDYIVVTTRPEEYSLENMDTFMNKMAQNDPAAHRYGGSWLQQMIHHIRPNVNFGNMPGAPPRYPLPTTVPKILGCVIADYSSQANVESTMNPARPPDSLSTQVNGVFHDNAAGALQSGINSITTRMRGIMNTISNVQVTAPPVPVTPPPENVVLTVGNDVYAAAGLTCLLAKIRAYQSLGPLTHNSGVPAPFIRQQDCVNVETGLPLSPAATKNMLERAADFKRRYDQLAWNILKLMDSDPGGKLHGSLGWALQDRRDAAGGPTRHDDGYPHVSHTNQGY